MQKSIFLKGLLLLQAFVVLVYTFMAFKSGGANLFTVFLDNIYALNWSGQFNLDFLCYLLLSGLWIMWRNQFSTSSIMIGISAMILGIIFFAPYVFWLLYKEKGNLRQVLVSRQ